MLENPAGTVKDGAFTQVNNGFSVRTDRWRYTEWDEGKDGAVLHEWTRTRQRRRNLAGDPAHAATVTNLKARLAAYRR